MSASAAELLSSLSKDFGGVEIALLEIDKKLCADSLSQFVKRAWSVVEPGLTYIHGWHIDFICAHLEAITRGDRLDSGDIYNRLLINIPPGTMKALDSDTPVLTLDGWRRHGDLAPGDFVFGPDGKPIRVIACTPEVLEESYTVTFDDGSEIVAGSGHEWEVEREFVTAQTKWRRKREKVIVNTTQLLAKDGHGRPDRIALCKSVWMPSRQLPVDPYILGAWLGDGGTAHGCLYTAEQDIAHFGALGTATKTTDSSARGQAFYRIIIPGLSKKLRVLGLLDNKHVPDNYLMASYSDRLALLQGLMDTDGCGIKTGQCTFTNKNKQIADAVAFLAASIGAKPYCSSRYTVLNGQKYGPHYKVDFRQPEGVQIFRLPRKAERARPAAQERSNYRYVQSVTPCGNRVVKCIQVEGGLYLAGKSLIATHNSLLTNVFWPAWEWGPKGMPHLRYVCAAHKVENLSARDSRRMRQLITSEWYQQRWGDQVSLAQDQNQKLNFQNERGGFRIATAIGSLTGIRGDRVIIDDPHSVDSAASETQRESEVTTFLEAIPTRLNDPIKSAIVVIMQRLHEDDVSGVIIDKKLGYDHIMLPMRYDSARSFETALGLQDPRQEEGELLFPERFPAKIVERDEKAMGPYAAAGQFQQEPTPRGGGVVKPDWWETWIHDSYPPMDYIIASLDTAYTTKQENDFSALTVWGIFTSDENIAQANKVANSDGTLGQVERIYHEGAPRVMLMSAWQDRLELSELVRKVASICTRMKVDKLLIESKASGLSVSQEIRRLYGHEDWAVQLINPGSVDKLSRLYSVQHLFSEGMIFAPDRSWADMVIHQCAIFPKGKHDDIVDTVSQALRHLRETGALVRAPERLAELDEGRHHVSHVNEPLYPV